MATFMIGDKVRLVPIADLPHNAHGAPRLIGIPADVYTGMMGNTYEVVRLYGSSSVELEGGHGFVFAGWMLVKEGEDTERDAVEWFEHEISRVEIRLQRACTKPNVPESEIAGLKAKLQAYRSAVWALKATQRLREAAKAAGAWEEV